MNTTIGVVATDLALGRAEAHRLAGAAHDGLARAVRPSHLLTDGDTFFGLATGTRERSAAPSSAEDVRQLNLLFAAAADVVARAIARGVLAARSHADRPSYRELFPSSTPSGHL
jgi:putative pantetheine hydrolase